MGGMKSGARGVIWLSVALISAGAFAEPRSERSAQMLGELFNCDTVPESERLQCYERKTAALKTAYVGKAFIVVDQEEVKTARRRLFGFALPDFNLFSRNKDGSDQDELKQIDAIITRVATSRDGGWAFTLDDGSNWVQSDNERPTSDPIRGDAITIKKAAMGSYLASVKGRRSIRVKRAN